MTAGFGDIWRDVRYGLRMILRNMGFSLAAIVTLALGIGGNTAIFTITNAFLLKPLPFHDPQKLIGLDLQRKNSGGGGSSGFSLNRFEQVRDRNRSFSAVAVAADDTLNLTGHGEPIQVLVARVSPNYLSVLGVRAEKGRSFTDEEGRPEGKPVVMISDSLWHTRFGGDPAIIDQTIHLDSAPYTVVGVVPPGIQCPLIGPADIWSPRYFELTLLTPQHIRAGVGYLRPIARLNPGASITSARVEMEVLNQQYQQENPKAPDGGPNVGIVAANLQDLIIGDLGLRLRFLFLAVGVVLLIACANVASLLLARALSRRKEMAVRAALGAARSSLIRQLLIESVMLAMAAGLGGLALSVAATRSLSFWAAGNLPPGVFVSADRWVLLFTLIISVFVGIAFGIFPALQLSHTNVNEALRDEGRSGTGNRRRTQLGGLLVIVQVMLSLVLLIGAGLLLRSFSYLLRADAGFEPHNVLSMNISLPTAKYDSAQKQIGFFDELLRRVSTAPGVASAAISAALPLRPVRITPVLPEGQPEVPLAERPFIIIETISPRYFATMGVPLHAGRLFTDADDAGAPRVLMVNEAFARRFWPKENPIGKHIVVGRQPPAEIVGVSGNVKNHSLALDTEPQIYLPFSQLPWASMNLLVRTPIDSHAMANTVRGQINGVDADQPITAVETMDEFLDNARAQPRFTALLLSIFSGVALVLATIGIYSLLSYSVVQRRPELGVRLALGAEKSDLLRMVVKQGLRLVSIGVGLGLVSALLLTRLLGAFLSLYKVSAYDLTTFVFGPIVFGVIGILASFLPAWRATQVSPTQALRNSD